MGGVLGLKRLQHLDLCYSYDQPTLDVPASLKAPTQPIASLQSLRLSCPVTPRFATILAASLDPKHLATIELDDLQEKTQEHAYRGLILKDEFPEGPELDLLRSPMSILLVQLTGKCPKLQNFQLRKIGQNFPYERHPWADSVDEHIYRDCAVFLTSARATLQSLVFEQDLPGYWNTQNEGGHRKDLYRLYGETLCFIKNERTMYRRFRELLLPVLLQDMWEALRKLEIRRIGLVAVRGVEEKLRGVVPYEAELMVEMAECMLHSKSEFIETTNAEYNTRKAK